MTSELLQQRKLIAALLQADAYSHKTGNIKLVETHISWVLLTGKFAYKIKKSVDFGFLDFSSLVRRKHFCERELEFNQVFSDGIYLDVVPITGSLEKPIMNGEGAEVMEYAVKMHQFTNGELFSELVDQNRLKTEHIEALAVKLTEQHQSTKIVKQGSERLIEKSCLGNIKALTWPATNDANDLALVEELGAWTLNKLFELGEVFKERENQGKVRLCHGDMHLANITLEKGEPVFFDCIEFNDDFRKIDVQSELAFLIMDLEFRQQSRLSNILLNRYLQLGGDYDGLRVLDFYKVYRALVKAKVNYLQANQESEFKAKMQHQFIYLKYLGVAKAYISNRLPRLTITHGVSGSGKSTQAARYASENNAIHINSDIERKRLFGLEEKECSTSSYSGGIYTKEATRSTYQKLLTMAGQIIEAGYCVIVDASFLESRYRTMFYQFTLEKNIPFQILDCHAPKQELERRIKERAASGTAVSEAGIEVMKQQLQNQQPLTDFEKQYVLRYNHLAEAI